MQYTRSAAAPARLAAAKTARAWRGKFIRAVGARKLAASVGGNDVRGKPVASTVLG
jgi:hypothetical protein